MLHARVVRPPSPAAELMAVDTGTVEAMPGFVAVVRDGSFLAVVAEREFQAVLAMRTLAAAAEWRERESLPEQSRLYDVLRELETEVGTVAEAGSPQVPDGERTRRMTFTRPYMMHGSIGPSCAVALMEGDALTVWSHTQGVYPDREAISELLGMPLERVRVIHVEGAGCYGHNGADDAAADAALIARALPGRPVRVQWTREQEHGWEPYGPAMTMDIAGTVGEDGRISHFTYDLWSNSHSTRPGGAARLIAGAASRQSRTLRPAGAEHQRLGQRRPQRQPLLRDPEQARPLALRQRDAAQGLGAAGARRLRQRLRARELHGRAGARRRRRPGRVPAAPPRGSPRSGGGRNSGGSASAGRATRFRRTTAAASPSRGTRTWRPTWRWRSSSR